MDFSLSSDQQAHIDTVTRFVRQEITPQVMALERGHAFPWPLLRKAWQIGILNLSIPGSVRGFEMDVVSTALIIEALSYGDTGISTSAMCNDLANCVIARHGTDVQRETFLRPFVEQPLLASFCLTEPDAGSDNAAMSSFIRKEPGGAYRLNGTKCFITNASFASQFTVFCKVEKPAGRFMACVVIPCTRESPALSDTDIAEGRTILPDKGGRIGIGRPEDKLGQRLSNTAGVTFEDVMIEPSQIIGDRRQGFAYVLDVLDYARPMVAAIGAGLARRALDVTLEYTRQRRQFGQRICDLPVARETLVSMWKKVELTRMALLTAAVKVQQGAPDRGVYASLAKNTAAEAALFCTAEGLHLHGGYGFMSEYEISKLARDAHVIDVYEGVREVQNMIIGREIC